MAFQGFDSQAIKQLASDLRTRGQDAPGLHSQLYNLLLTAGWHMGSKPATVDPDLEQVIAGGFMGPLFGYQSPPGSLSELTDTADEMDRRREQLDACNALHDAGYPINEEMVFADEDPPSQEDIDEALAALRGIGDVDPGNDGNRDEIREVTSLLAGLTDAELDAVIAQATPEELAEFNRIISDKSDTLWYDWGLPEAERREVVYDIMSRVSPANLPAVTEAFPWLQPDMENTDAFRDGNVTGWFTPTDPLIADGVSAEDMHQGSFGDCWYLASVAAIAQRDPEFIEEGIRENPNGTVSVRIWDQQGNEMWVTVTADLPARPDGSPGGAYGDGETWPAYYEKAFAQVYGEDNDGLPENTYGAIEGDWPEMAAPYLTGEDSDESDGNWFEGQYDQVKEAFDNGHPVTIYTPGEADNVPEAWEGDYSTGHAYYVKGFDDDGNIIIGNPWGPDHDITATPEQFEEFFIGGESINMPE